MWTFDGDPNIKTQNSNKHFVVGLQLMGYTVNHKNDVGLQQLSEQDCLRY